MKEGYYAPGGIRANEYIYGREPNINTDSVCIYNWETVLEVWQEMQRMGYKARILQISGNFSQHKVTH